MFLRITMKVEEGVRDLVWSGGDYGVSKEELDVQRVLIFSHKGF